MKKKRITLYFLWITGMVLLVATFGFGDDKDPCPAPDRIFFELRTNSQFTNQSQGFIPLQANKDIGFVLMISQPTSTLISRANGTLNFGDESKEEPISILKSTTKLISGQTVTHSYGQGGKSYRVHLTMANICSSPAGTSSTREYSNTIYIVDGSSRASLEGLAQCDVTEISEEAASDLSTDDLIFLVKMLRSSRGAREEVIAIIKKAVKDLDRIDSIHDDFIRRTELNNIVNDVDQASSKIIRPSDRRSLDAIKAACTKMAAIDGPQSARKEIRRDIENLTELEISSGNNVIAGCDKTIAAVERKLRKRGDRLVKKNYELEDAKQKTEISKDEWSKYADKIKENKTTLRSINNVTKLTVDDLFQTFDDYDRYFFKFTTGYEFITVNKLFQKGNPIIGFIVSQRFNEPVLADSQDGWRWPVWGYGWQSKFAALVAGSGEQETVISSPTSTTAPINSGEEKSLGIDEELFFPIYRTARFNDGKLWEYFGPVALIGARLVDKNSGSSTSTDFDSRFYAGIKFAINPELYTDILYGKTQHLQSKRLELRAQLPIYRADKGSRFFLGAIANIGVKDKVADEADSLRIYITWNIDFGTVYSSFSSKKLDQSSENK